MIDPQEDGTVRRFLRFIQNLSGDAVGKSLYSITFMWQPLMLSSNLLI